MGEVALRLDLPAEDSAEFDVVAVSDLGHETFVRKRHERWLGALAVDETVDMTMPESFEGDVTIIDLLEKARDGDEQALEAVRTNAHTTVVETLLKTGNITRISAQFDKNQGLSQHNHRYEAIHRNAWLAARNRSSKAQRLSTIEALNWQRTEAAMRAGYLDSHWLVVFSLVSDDMPVADLKKEGLFVHTMTGVIQATTLAGSNVTTESAFVAGMQTIHEDAELSDEQNNARIADAAQDRYDIETIRAMYRDWGIADAMTLSAEQLLATPLLIPKKRMPHGVADIVKLYDEHLGDTFFGLDQPAQPYETFADVCQQKAAQYDDITDNVVRDLLRDALSFARPAQAVNRLYTLAKNHALQRAYRDTSIDVTVFGSKAAPLIERARTAYERGDQTMFAMLATRAQEVAVTTACGGGSGADKSSDKPGQGDDLMNGETNSETWKWKRGVCRVESCPTRPGVTEIGPCDVCRRCQGIFDKGIDPTKFKTRPKIARTLMSIAIDAGTPKAEKTALAVAS